MVSQDDARQKFENSFLFTQNYRGKKFGSLDEVTNFIKKEFPLLNFYEFEILAQKSNENNHISMPFGYIIAKQGSDRIYNIEYLGFKIDSDKIFILGPPYLEKSTELACAGTVDGYRLYDGPEKKLELLVHTD